MVEKISFIDILNHKINPAQKYHKGYWVADHLLYYTSLT